jgi:hypothetical protein
MLGFIL